MSAVKLDLRVEQGITYLKSLTWKDEFGVLINLTDYTAHMQIRQSIASPGVLVDIDNTVGITLGGVAGTIELRIESGITDVIHEDEGVYDLELTAPDSTVTRLIEGTVTFVKGVTR